MKGMTGYSFKEIYNDDSYISTEIKTVNHRFLELNVHVPQYLNSLELSIKELVSESISRGKVDVNVYLRLKDFSADVKPNYSLIEQYYSGLKEIAGRYKLEDSVKMEHLLRFDDIMVSEYSKDYSAYWGVIKDSIAHNLREICDMRDKEGEATGRNLTSIVDDIKSAVTKIKLMLPDMEKNIFETLKLRMTELIGDKVPDDRIVMEAALVINRACVNEEVQRLEYHTAQFLKISSENKDVGKRLDFVCQEMNREINTLGSKVTLSGILEFVIAIKNNIEKLREQIRNIE